MSESDRSDHDSSQPSSDELDEDYYDRMVTSTRSSRHLSYTTPRRRADKIASLSTAARQAVLSKSRTPERCFMTLENAPRCVIEVCHFIPKATRASELLALEYNVGLSARTINVNTVQNLDFLRADLHRSFDRGDWILIPSTDALTRIEQRLQSLLEERKGGTKLSSNMYHEFAYTPPNWQEYRVVYLNVSEDITVIRRRSSPPSSSTDGPFPDPSQTSSSQPPPPSHDFYRAPFDNFPDIHLYIHPFCVIYNAGKRLYNNPYFRPPSHIDQSDLETVKRLHGQFTAPPPPSWGRDVSNARSETSSDEERDFRRRRRRSKKDSAGPSTKKRQSFVKTNGAAASTVHTTRKAGRGRRHGGHLSKRTHTLDTSMTAPTPERDSLASTDNLVPCDDCKDRLAPSLKDWVDGVTSFAGNGEGNAPLLNDHQIGSYVGERARKPFRYPWHSWRVSWGHTCDPDTSRFSSNDWAYWLRTFYLTL